MAESLIEIQDAVLKLHKIAKKEYLPFKADKSNYFLHYTGPKNRIEKYVLDLYEIFYFEESELAHSLGASFLYDLVSESFLDNTIPQYSKYLEKTSKERRIQKKIGNIECDGHNFYATDKALDEISERKSFAADTAAYFSFTSKENNALEEKLKSLGVSTKKPSKLKAIIAGGFMLAAAIGGAALAKDALADDASDLEDNLETNSRQGSEPIMLDIENVASESAAIYENKVVWGMPGRLKYFDAGPDKIFGTSDDLNITLPYSDSSVDIHKNYIVLSGENDTIFLHNLNNAETLQLNSTNYVNNNDPKIYGDYVVWDSYISIMFYNIKTGQTNKIIDTPRGCDSLNIWKDKVIFSEMGHLKIYNITTGKTIELANRLDLIHELDISDNIIVWEEDVDTIVYMDINSGKIRYFEGSNPYLYKDKISFYNNKTKSLDIYNSKTNKNTTIKNNPNLYTVFSAIWDDKITWCEEDDKHLEPIYLAYLDIQTNNTEMSLKIKQFAPTFVLSKDEKYKPATPEKIASGGDDEFVANNREIYEKNSKLFEVNGKPVVFAQEPKEIGGFTYYTYWLYYANNSITLDSHEHDWEYVIVKTNNDGNIVSKAASFHLVGHKRTDNLEDNVFIEEDGHAMSFNQNDFASKGTAGFFKFNKGEVLQPNEYTIIPLEDIINNNNLDKYGRYKSGPDDWAAGDLKKNGDALLMEIFGDRAAAPWKQDIYTNPEKAWEKSNLEEIIVKVDCPVELIVKDSSGKIVNDLKISSTEDSAFIRQADDDDYIYQIISKEKGIYNLTILKVGEEGTLKTQATNIEIKKSGETHEYKINWDGVEKNKKDSVTLLIGEDRYKTDNNITQKDLKKSKESSDSWCSVAIGGVVVATGIGIASYLKRQSLIKRAKKLTKSFDEDEEESLSDDSDE